MESLQPRVPRRRIKTDLQIVYKLSAIYGIREDKVMAMYNKCNQCLDDTKVILRLTQLREQQLAEQNRKSN